MRGTLRVELCYFLKSYDSANPNTVLMYLIATYMGYTLFNIPLSRSIRKVENIFQIFPVI